MQTPQLMKDGKKEKNFCFWGELIGVHEGYQLKSKAGWLGKERK